MSGKKAKLARKAIREAGGEDKVTRKLRVIHERMEAEEAAQRARAERIANETPEDREARENADRASMRRVGLLMSSLAAISGGMVASLPSWRIETGWPTGRGR